METTFKRRIEELHYESAQANSQIDKLNRNLLEERKAKENALNRYILHYFISIYY